LHTHALFCEPDTLEEGLPGHVNELLRFGADAAAGIGCSAIAMKSLKVRAHVHRHDVPVFQDVMSRNPVDDRAVDADARAGRIAAVVQERRFRALRDDIIVNGLINCLCRYAGSYHFPCQSTGCRGNFAGLAHRFQLMFIFDCNHAFAPIALRISSLAPSMDWLPLTVRSLPSLP
jgi:hypothetical protein